MASGKHIVATLEARCVVTPCCTLKSTHCRTSHHGGKKEKPRNNQIPLAAVGSTRKMAKARRFLPSRRMLLVSTPRGEIGAPGDPKFLGLGLGNERGGDDAGIVGEQSGQFVEDGMVARIVGGIACHHSSICIVIVHLADEAEPILVRASVSRSSKPFFRIGHVPTSVQRS